MLVLEPALAVLDETDSGLDIDALKVVARGVNSLRSADRGVLLITHYQRLLDHIVPDQVHVLARGTHRALGRQDAGARAREARLRLGARGRVMTVALPTNKDENWRYANLRPLAKATRRRGASGRRCTRRLPCPPPLPDYERWVFVDGRFAASLSAPLPDSRCATLLNARDAGEEFTAMLDAAIATEGPDFALARVNGARGDQVLHIAPPDGAERDIELDVRARRAGAASGTSYPRVQVHAGRRCARAHRRAPPERRQRVTPPSMPHSISRCAPTRASITAGCRISPTPRAASTR